MGSMKQVQWVLTDENHDFVVKYRQDHNHPNQHEAINAILDEAREGKHEDHI